MIKLEENTLL